MRGVFSGYIGEALGGVGYCVWWLVDTESQRTGPLSEEWLLTPDLAG